MTADNASYVKLVTLIEVRCFPCQDTPDGADGQPAARARLGLASDGLARRGVAWHDPDTSRIAADRVKKSELRRKVLLALYRVGEHGATDEELGVATGLTSTSAGTRRGELRSFGLVLTTSERRLTLNNNPARVHRLTDVGRRLAAELAKEW